MGPSGWERVAKSWKRIPAWVSHVWQWRTLVGWSATIVLAGAGLAVWGSRDPQDGVSAGLLTAVSGLLAAQTFLATLGLTFGRGDTYRRAVDYLHAEDLRLGELSAIDGTVALEDLERLFARTVGWRARMLREALDPATPPSISREGHRRAIEAAASRERAADRERERRAREWGIAESGEGEVVTRDERRTRWDTFRQEARWVEGVLAHTRAAEARIALICYLAAGVVALSFLIGGLAGWRWTSRPAPEFYALLALSAASLCVCAMALLARHESMAETRDALSWRFLPHVELSELWNSPYLFMGRSGAECLAPGSVETRN